MPKGNDVVSHRTVKEILCFHLLALLLWGVSTGHAAVFLPEDEELSKRSPDARTAEQKRVSAMLANLPPEAETLQVGDMLFNVATLRAKGAFSHQKWPGNKVVYQFESTLGAYARQAFLDAAAEWSKVADLTFVQKTNEVGYIYVRQGTTIGSSFVGYQGNAQNLVFVYWGFKYGLVHEIGHALGFIHEHSRYDRNSYVEINWSNIQPGMDYAFNMWTPSTTDGPYDFESNMHYHKAAYAANPNFNTITPVPAYMQFLPTMGQLSRLSDYDIIAIRNRYGPPRGSLNLDATWLDLTHDLDGDVIKLSGRLSIQNNGAGKSKSCKVRVWLSDDTVYDKKDKLLDKFSVSPMKPGKNRLKTVRGKVPKKLGVSGKYILAVLEEKSETPASGVVISGPL